MACYVRVFSSGSLNWQYFQPVFFFPSVRLVFPSYMPHLYCCSHFSFLALLLFYWLYDPVVIREGSLVDPVTWQSAAQGQECSFRSYWDLIPGEKQFSFFFHERCCSEVSRILALMINSTNFNFTDKTDKHFSNYDFSLSRSDHSQVTSVLYSWSGHWLDGFHGLGLYRVISLISPEEFTCVTSTESKIIHSRTCICSISCRVLGVLPPMGCLLLTPIHTRTRA